MCKHEVFFIIFKNKVECLVWGFRNFITFFSFYLNALNICEKLIFIKILKPVLKRITGLSVTLLSPHPFVGKHFMHKNCTSFISISFCLFYVHKSSSSSLSISISLSQQNCWTIFYAFLTYRSSILFASTVFLLPFQYFLFRFFCIFLLLTTISSLFKHYYSTCSCVINLISNIFTIYLVCMKCTRVFNWWL